MHTYYAMNTCTMCMCVRTMHCTYSTVHVHTVCIYNVLYYIKHIHTMYCVCTYTASDDWCYVCVGLQTIFEVGLKPGSSAIQVMQQKRSLHGNIVVKEREKRVATSKTADFVAEKPQEVKRR